jgi:hypothetical protein
LRHGLTTVLPLSRMRRPAGTNLADRAAVGRTIFEKGPMAARHALPRPESRVTSETPLIAQLHFACAVKPSSRLRIVKSRSLENLCCVEKLFALFFVVNVGSSATGNCTLWNPHHHRDRYRRGLVGRYHFALGRVRNAFENKSRNDTCPHLKAIGELRRSTAWRMGPADTMQAHRRQLNRRPLRHWHSWARGALTMLDCSSTG